MPASLAAMFAEAPHNPTFEAIRSSAAHDRPLVDYCVPANPYFPPRAVLEMARANLEDLLKYYPDYGAENARRIAALTGLDPANIVVGNGSTEIITQLCHSLTGTVVTPVPTFGRWTDLPLELGRRVHTVEADPARDFEVPADELVRAVREQSAQCLVICNPNNPTGACISDGDLRALVYELADVDLIVIDESFIDFSDLATASALAVARDNVIVVKSLGKSIGWHGVRLGYAVANVELAHTMRLATPYWNVNGLASFVLARLSELQHEYRVSFERVKQDRAYMIHALAADRRLKVYPSQANFVYVGLPPQIAGTRLRDELLMKHGMIIRECSNKQGSSASFLRIAVRGRDATDRLAAALSEELVLLERSGELVFPPRRGCASASTDGCTLE